MDKTETSEKTPQPLPKNGVPDGAEQADAKGTPTSDRKDTETAAKP